MLAGNYNAPGSFNELKQGRSSLYSKPDVHKQIGLNFSFTTDDGWHSSRANIAAA